MRLLCIVFAAALALGATEPQDKKKPAPAPAKLIKQLEIPAGAVEREPGTFFYTDQDGKKWIYRRTPFGVARYEDKPVDPNAPKPVDELANVKVIDQGDTVKFERPGPFGTYKWEKKKSELDEKEKAAVKKAQDSSQQDK
jgi:hypothetical protein